MDFQLSPDLLRWQMEVRAFVQRELQPYDQLIEESGVVPPDILTKMAQLGLFGTNTPREYGGLGLSMLGSCLAVEELAKAHVAFYYRCGVNIHIGSKAIEFDGSNAIKEQWLPPLSFRWSLKSKLFLWRQNKSDRSILTSGNNSGVTAERSVRVSTS